MTGYKGFFLKGETLCFSTLPGLGTGLRDTMLLRSPGQIVFIEGRMNWESIGLLGMAEPECARGAEKCIFKGSGDGMLGEKDDL